MLTSDQVRAILWYALLGLSIVYFISEFPLDQVTYVYQQY